LAGTTFTQTIGDGSATSFIITHNLGTRDVVTVLRNANSPYEVIEARWEATTTSTVTLDFSSPPAANSVRVVVYTAIAGSTITINSIDDLGDVTITSAASGDFLKWNGSAWVNDPINLGTDTVGSYVASLVAGTGVTLSNNSGEGATPTVAVDTTVIQARVANISDIEIGYLDGVTSAIQTQINSKAPTDSPTFTGTVSGVTKGHVGLGNVDNTSDADKPVSTATQTALDLKSNLASPTFTGTVTTNNLVVSGNLTVSGTTTSLNTETVTIDDNIIVLNNNATGPASGLPNAAVEIERGDAPNVALRWNETDDKWQFTNDGSTYSDIGSVTAASIIAAAGGDGTNGQALTTNGAGVLDFTTITGTTEASIIAAVGGDGPAGAVLSTNGSGDLSFTTSPSFSTVAAGAITIDSTGEINTSTQSVTTNEILTVDSFNKTVYRTAKYLIQVTQGLNQASKYTTSEVLLAHDGTTSYMSEYAVIELGSTRIPLTVSTSISSNDVLLRVTITDAATTNATVKVARTLIAV